MFLRVVHPREMQGTVGMSTLRELMMADSLPNKSDYKNMCSGLASLTQPVIIHPDKT
jgi:hypothetical protein